MVNLERILFTKGLLMRAVFLFGLCAIAACLAISTTALAGGPDPADFPLRVHVMKNSSQSSHPRESKSFADSDTADYVTGMGAADLFENGQPQGFQFSYSCIGGMKPSSGYGAYPARWKKQGKTLEILLPETGKPWNLLACELHAQLRPTLAFYWRNGVLAEESAAVLKAWMVKHKYDPERDMVDPVMADGETQQPADSSDPQLAEPN